MKPIQDEARIQDVKDPTPLLQPEIMNQCPNPAIDSAQSWAATALPKACSPTCTQRSGSQLAGTAPGLLAVEVLLETWPEIVKTWPNKMYAGRSTQPRTALHTSKAVGDLLEHERTPYACSNISCSLAQTSAICHMRVQILGILFTPECRTCVSKGEPTSAKTNQRDLVELALLAEKAMPRRKGLES